MKRRLVLLSTILVLSSAIVSPVASYAENFEAQIQQNNETIQALQQEQAEKLQQLSTLVSEIENTQLEVDAIAQQIQETQNQIVTLETEITYLNEVIAKRAEKIVEQARYLQTENTSDDFLKAVFSSQSIVEALEKIWAMAELTSASNDVLQQQKTDKEKVISKKEELDSKLAEQGQRAAQMQTLATEQAARRQNLETVLAGIEEQTLNAQAQNAELAEKLEQARRVQEQLAAERQAAEQQSAAAAAAAQAAQDRQDFAASQNDSSSNTSSTTSNDSTPASDSSSSSGFIPGGGNFAAINPNYVASLNGGYPGQCTWYVYNRLAYLGAPIKHWRMGNGGEWGYYGRLNGYHVSNTPKAGRAASFKGSSYTVYGHVAFVEEVYADGSILVSEMNMKGEFVISTRHVSAAEASTLDYIDFGL